MLHTNVSRRNFILQSSASLSAFFLQTGMSYADGAPVEPTLNGEQQKAFQAIENLLWIPNKQKTINPIYVIFTPWCPRCRQFFIDCMNNKFNGYDFRFIPLESKNEPQHKLVYSLLKYRYVDLLWTYIKARQVVDEEYDKDVLQNALSTLVDYTVLQNVGVYISGYPSFIWVSDGQIRASSGYKDQSSVTSIANSPPRSVDFVPEATNYMFNKPVVVEEINKNYFVDKDTDVYIQPSIFALSRRKLSAHRGLFVKNIISINGQKWAESPDAATTADRNFSEYYMV